MALGVNIVSDFNASGITKAIKDFKKLEGAGKKTGYALLTFDKALTNGLVNLGKFAAGVGAVAGVIGYKLASAAYESQKVMKQTEAIIRSTGSAANVTSDQVAKLSTKLSMQIGVDDELIQSTANLLLTFKQVTNQVGENNHIFDRAVVAAQDLGNVFGSADAAAMQLGKALSDPEKGISALRRAGINFTESQKQQIKTMMEAGDILGAQKLILAEVESQVGGTAAATATGFDRMKVAVGNVAENLGTLLIPYIERFATFVIDKVVPYLDRVIAAIDQRGLAGALQMVGGDILNAITEGGKFVNTMLAIVTAFAMLKAAALAFSVAQSAATIAVTAFGVAWNATGIGLVAAAIAAVVVGLVALYVKFEGVRKVVDAVGKVLFRVFQEIAEKIFNFFIGKFNAVLMVINAGIRVARFFGAEVETIGHISQVSFGEAASAAEQAAKRMAAAQKVAGRPFEQLVGDYRGEMPKVVNVVKDIVTGGGKAVETAKEKLKKFIDGLKGVTSAQRAYRDATKGIEKANNDLADANDRLAKAQSNFQQVVKGFGLTSKQGRTQQQVVTQAQRSLERAGYGVEEAVFAVAKAEQDLAAIRLDPEANPQAIREAEIALAEAKLSVQDATDQQTEATQNLADAQSRLDEIVNGAKEGSDAYTEALKELQDAQKAQKDAIDSQTEAYERQRDAVDALREAEEKLAELRKTTPDKLERRAANILNTPLKIASPSASSAGIDYDIAAGLLTLNAMQGTIPAFAAGGLVTSPTIGLIGEAGPEAVVPLDQLSTGMNITVNITAGMGADPTTIGDEIVNVLQRYNRRNGALPLKVA